MPLMDKNSSQEFWKGYTSVLNLYPQIDLPQPIKSHVKVPESDFLALYNDWETIGQDFSKYMQYEQHPK